MNYSVIKKPERLSEGTESDREKGSVVVETALAVILLMIFIVGIIDIGRLLHTYIVLTQVVSESARFASRLADLPTGEYSSTDVNPIPDPHLSVHNRVRMLLGINSKSVEIEQVSVKSRYIDSPTKMVHIDVSGVYRGFFPVFDGLTINSSHSAAYLVSTS